VHCLKYGLTTNNVLGIEMVLMDGEVVRLGGKHLDAEGYDLLGLMSAPKGCSASSPRSPCASCASRRRRAPC
jgi:FAD/FMN-containing dehydrogenase